MNYIKIPFSIKFYLFFNFVLLLISFLLLDYGYSLLGVNEYIIVEIIGILFLCINLLFLFKFFINPKNNLYFYIIIGFIIFILISSFINIFINDGWLNGISFIYIFFYSIFLVRLLIFRKKIKIGDIQFSNKNQFKNTLFVFGITFLFLLLFYIVYYSKPVIEFKKIDDKYFDNNIFYENIDNTNNGISYLKEYSINLQKIDHDYIDIYNKILDGNKIEIEFEEEKLKEIDGLKKGIKNIIDSKSIVYDYRSDEIISLQGFSNNSKEYLYNALYYIEKGDEIRGVDYLIDNYKLHKKILGGYGGIVIFIVGIINLDITIVEINYILDNYELQDDTINYIYSNLENTDNIDSSYKNAVNFDYNYLNNLIKNNLTMVKNTTLLNDKNYYHNGLKNIYYDHLEGNGDFIYNFCDKKGKLRSNIFTNLFLKKNTYSNILLIQNCISLVDYSVELEKLIEKNNQLLDRLR